MLKRNEPAHANSVEHFPLFVGAMIWAHVAGLSHAEINASRLVYTVARVAFAAVYVLVDTPTMSKLRGVCWWVSNIVCLRLFWVGGKGMDSRV